MNIDALLLHYTFVTLVIWGVGKVVVTQWKPTFDWFHFKFNLHKLSCFLICRMKLIVLTIWELDIASLVALANSIIPHPLTWWSQYVVHQSILLCSRQQILVNYHIQELLLSPVHAGKALQVMLQWYCHRVWFLFLDGMHIL